MGMNDMTDIGSAGILLCGAGLRHPRGAQPGGRAGGLQRLRETRRWSRPSRSFGADWADDTLRQRGRPWSAAKRQHLARQANRHLPD